MYNQQIQCLFVDYVTYKFHIFTGDIKNMGHSTCQDSCFTGFAFLLMTSANVQWYVTSAAYRIRIRYFHSLSSSYQTSRYLLPVNYKTFQNRVLLQKSNSYQNYLRSPSPCVGCISNFLVLDDMEVRVLLPAGPWLWPPVSSCHAPRHHGDQREI